MPTQTLPPAPNNAVIEFRGVSLRYDNGHAGLDQATFAIERSDFVFMIGSTGSGKSTVMRLLIKELEPQEGVIRVAGRELASISRKHVPYYRRNIGVVFQDFKLLPNRTVYDNVAYALQVTGHSRQARSARRCRTSCASPGSPPSFTTIRTSCPAVSSSASRSRARSSTIRRCCSPTSRPGTSIPETSIDIMRLLYRINRTGTTVLVATHDHAMVDKMRRRVLELSQGRIIRDEATGLYQRDESTREFVTAASRR